MNKYVLNALGVALIGLVVVAGWGIVQTVQSVRHVDQATVETLSSTRRDAYYTAEQLSDTLFAVGRAAVGINDNVTALRTGLLNQTGSVTKDLHSSLLGVTDGLGRTLQTTRASEAQLSDTAMQLRVDMKPTIDGANLLMQRNALPAQILGLTAASKVAVGQWDLMARDIRPEVKPTAQAVRGITQDVHKMTTDLTGPKPWYKKLYDVVSTTSGFSKFFF